MSGHVFDRTTRVCICGKGESDVADEKKPTECQAFHERIEYMWASVVVEAHADVLQIGYPGRPLLRMNRAEAVKLASALNSAIHHIRPRR